MAVVSVVMSVFNGGELLAAAVESVLAQTFTDFEFIIIDDGSTDRSVEVLHGYNDPRIILVRQENRGIAAALNRGLELASGYYIARQDADDLSFPQRLTTQTNYLDNHPEIAVLGTAALVIDSVGRPFSTFWPFTRHERLVKELLRGICPLMHGSVMMRREAVRNVGGYNPAFGHAQDVELWLRIAGRYRLGNIRDVLYQYRKHESSVTQLARVDLKIKTFAQAGKFSTATSPEEWKRFVEAFDREFSGTWRERAFEAETHLSKARVAIARRDGAAAIRLLGAAVRLYPPLFAEVPGRVLRRIWRTILPTVG